MSIFKYLSKYFFEPKEKMFRIENESPMLMTEREVEVYGQDELSIRRMYEKWACKEHWLLYDEAIPLLFCIEPYKKYDLDDEIKKEMEELCSHAKDCVNKKLLLIVNNERDEKEWQVSPVDLYRWATVSRISVPSELNDLMQFVVQTIKNPVLQNEQNIESDNRDANYQKHREIVLGAAMSILVNRPDICMNSKNKIKENLVVKQIIKNRNQWFGEEEPLLTESAMIDLINQYLKLIRPVL